MFSLADVVDGMQLEWASLCSHVDAAWADIPPFSAHLIPVYHYFWTRSYSGLVNRNHTHNPHTEICDIDKAVAAVLDIASTTISRSTSISWYQLWSCLGDLLIWAERGRQTLSCLHSVCSSNDPLDRWF